MTGNAPFQLLLDWLAAKVLESRGPTIVGRYGEGDSDTASDFRPIPRDLLHDAIMRSGLPLVATLRELERAKLALPIERHGPDGVSLLYAVSVSVLDAAQIKRPGAADGRPVAAGAGERGEQARGQRTADPPDTIARLAEPTADESKITYSLDCRSVNWYGTLFAFTPLQAACVKVLIEHTKHAVPDVGEQTILEAVESGQTRLAGVFDKGNHPAWGTMIVPGQTKGAFRIARKKS